MKNLVKKNQVIIAALAIMIAIAGYLNFTKDDANETEQTVNVSDAIGYDIFTDIEDETEGIPLSDTGEALLEATSQGTEPGEDGLTVEEALPGEAVLANTTLGSSFFSTAKLTREQTRARNKETLMQIVENTEVSEEQKQEAFDAVIKMTETAELENATELLLEAKGFDGVVVNIVEDSVDVVVNSETITDQQVAQIEDVVIRKTGFGADSIVISAVIVEE